jgi:hypothetical protein
MSYTIRQASDGQWCVIDDTGATRATFPTNAAAWGWAERQETHPLYLRKKTAMRLGSYSLPKGRKMGRRK